MKRFAYLSIACGLLSLAGSTAVQAKNDVVVCHSGNSIWVDTSSVQKHVAHGDTIGYCEAPPCQCPAIG